jgi:hypothetical protein
VLFDPDSDFCNLPFRSVSEEAQFWGQVRVRSPVLDLSPFCRGQVRRPRALRDRLGVQFWGKSSLGDRPEGFRLVQWERLEDGSAGGVAGRRSMGTGPKTSFEDGCGVVWLTGLSDGEPPVLQGGATAFLNAGLRPLTPEFGIDGSGRVSDSGSYRTDVRLTNIACNRSRSTGETRSPAAPCIHPPRP